PTPSSASALSITTSSTSVALATAGRGYYGRGFRGRRFYGNRFYGVVIDSADALDGVGAKAKQAPKRAPAAANASLLLFCLRGEIPAELPLINMVFSNLNRGSSDDAWHQKT
ncbi:MAG: hypothetical protein AAF668_12640, partial [Pseudomonadota bacterium]